MDVSTMEEVKKAVEDKMHKSIEKFKEELNNIRTGRANPHILDHLSIEYYGTPTPVNQVANISVPDPRTLMVTPYDASALGLIEKAILASDLNLPPNSDGKVLRILFPQLTADSRGDMVKQVKKKAEEAKVAIRNVRRDGNDLVKKLKGSEDEEKNQHDEIQQMTDRYIKIIDDIEKDKEKEVLEI